MKWEKINPWVVIRWMAAAALYALTLAICINLIDTNRKARENAEKKLDDFRDDHKMTTKELVRYKVDLHNTTLSLDAAREALNLMIKESDNLKQNESLVESKIQNAWKEGHDQGQLEALKSTQAEMVKAARTYTPPTPALSTSSASPTPTPIASVTSPSASSSYTNRTITRKEKPAPGAPMWHPPLGTQGDRIIRKMATDKWGNDYSMVEYEVGRQKKALETLVSYNKKANSTGKTILANAYQAWGEDYTMMLYEAEKQSNALDRLNGR